MIFISEFSLSSVKSRFCEADKSVSASFRGATLGLRAHTFHMETCLTRSFTHSVYWSNISFVLQKVAGSE